ncbi:hypothetical protein BAE44_0000370, partial [Dichanthelium oligosanthes]
LCSISAICRHADATTAFPAVLCLMQPYTWPTGCHLYLQVCFLALPSYLETYLAFCFSSLNATLGFNQASF